MELIWWGNAAWQNYLCKTAKIPKWCFSVTFRSDGGGCCAPEEGFMDVPEMLALPSGKTHTFYSENNIFGDTAQSRAPFFILNCFGAWWAPHRPTCSFGTSLKSWHQSKKHCMGLKPKLCFYRWIHWLLNYVDFEWKPSPKGFKKHDSVMPLGWGGLYHGRVSPCSEDTKLEWICPTMHKGFFVKQSGKRHVPSFHLNDTGLGNSVLLPVVLSKA